MRNIMLVGLLIVALIIGILVVKDMQTEDQAGTKNIERVDRAKEAADIANEASNRMRDAAKEAASPQPQPVE
ncbi:MAG: hypothetical protein Q7U02_11960 [Desulfosalsimonadaceae bacterium]|nr:hypothetical protein [Desulfosalsimonadaceae bacterium]